MAYQAPQLRKNLSKNGLSMSQAQTVSNLAYQNALAIQGDVAMFNNASKVVAYKGTDHVQQKGIPISNNIAELLNKIGGYYGAQAFLMENIKCKDEWLNELKKATYVTSEELLKTQPKVPSFADPKLQKPVDENWAWAKLTTKEMAEYWEVEARAAHIGAFIHKGGKLDTLRKQLPSIPSLEWMNTPGPNGDSFPITVTTHHTISDLTKLHNELANTHKELEQRVNYFKAKVKNLVTEENAKRAQENGIEQAKINQENNKLMNEWKTETLAYEGKRRVEEEEFEKNRNEDIRFVAALRIEVDPRFQKVIDELMPKVAEVKDGEA